VNTADPAFEYDVVVSLVLFCTAPAEIASCIDQILASRRRTHVVVVDNSPSPVALPQPLPAHVSVLYPGGNIGYGRGHNRAIAAAKGQAPFHLIMNTDVSLRGDVIDEMVGFMEANPDAGMSSPLIHYPDGSLQTSCRLLPSPANIFGRGFLDKSAWTQKMNREYELQDWGYDRVENIPFLPGCFMLCRSDVLAQVAGFDERYFLFAEDLDLSRRIYQVSKCMFVPSSVIEHELRSRVRFSWRRHLYKVINLSRYFNKWGWIRDPERKRINQATLRRVFG
jgi:GT2 family glycosyltransferase